MVLLINQETFNEAVAENMTEFGLSESDAVDDAVKQFEAQGVDLSNIIKDVMVSNPGNTNAITEIVTNLSKLFKSKDATTPEQFIQQLTLIKNECDKGMEYRVYAGKEGAYNVIMDVMLKNESNVEVTKHCLKALISLMTKQPDLLDDRGVQTMITNLDKSKDAEIQILILKWVKECCVMHELNRQNIFNANILDHLKPLIEDANAAMLRDILAVFRALVLDDDVRVEFGRAHEHARVIASDVLCSITELLSKFKADESLMTDLMLTLSSLLVRNEFCKKVEDAGALTIIKEVMITFHNSEKLIKQCLKLLKALAGNDEVKIHIIQKDFAPVIVSSLSVHKGSPNTATIGLSCIAAITLRSPENSKVLFEANAAEVIIETMKQHPDDMNKNGSWAIRNMVSRSRNQTKMFLSLGAEAILQDDLKKFKGCEYDIKSALRDLGCNVDLKEEWTGKGGKITTQSRRV